MAIDRFAPWAEDILQTCFHLWFIYFLCGYKRCKIFNDTSALTIIVNMFLSSAQMQDHPSFFKHNNQENKENKKKLLSKMATAKMIISSRSSNQWAVSIFYIQSIVCTKRARETKRRKRHCELSARQTKEQPQQQQCSESCPRDRSFIVAKV